MEASGWLGFSNRCALAREDSNPVSNRDVTRVCVAVDSTMSFHPFDALLDSVGFDSKASLENKTVVPFVDSYFTDEVPIFASQRMTNWGDKCGIKKGKQAELALIASNGVTVHTNLTTQSEGAEVAARHVLGLTVIAAKTTATMDVPTTASASTSASAMTDQDDVEIATEQAIHDLPDYEIGDTTVDGDGVTWREVLKQQRTQVKQKLIQQPVQQCSPGTGTPLKLVKTLDAVSAPQGRTTRKKTKKTKKMAVVVMIKAGAQATRERFTCRVCNKSFKQRKHLNEHIKRAHSPKVRCAMCNEPFTNHAGNIKRHILRVHNLEV